MNRWLPLSAAMNLDGLARSRTDRPASWSPTIHTSVHRAGGRQPAGPLDEGLACGNYIYLICRQHNLTLFLWVLSNNS